MTYVTKIYMPNKEKFKSYIDKIYESGWITNNGPLVQELEKKLQKHFGVKNLLCLSSGTDALQFAYKLMETTGEVITTPFTFISTTSAIAAEKLTPVFADIDPKTYNINPDNIEDVITDKTCAIAPCHVFGNACEIEKIDKIAQKYNLKVVYDASHAFDTVYKNRHILSYGDFSIISFHGTKMFHTIEGGAIVIKDDALYEKAKMIREYGKSGPDEVGTIGVNAKMNEFEAAMGLCMLDEIDIILNERKTSYEFYVKELKDYVQLQSINPDANKSYSYFPVVFQSEEEMKEVRSALNELDIFPRQYFFPSLDTIPYVEKRKIMTNSQDLCSRILVIPMHSKVEPIVSKTIKEVLKKIR